MITLAFDKYDFKRKTQYPNGWNIELYKYADTLDVNDCFQIVRNKLKEVEEKDSLRNWKPPVTGEDIMQAFNMSPGKQIGIIKDAITEAILEGVIKNDRKEALDFMILKGKELGLTSK